MAVDRALADTSFIIDVGKNRAEAVSKATELEKQGTKICISTVTVYELSAGAPPGLEPKIQRLLQPLQIIPFEYEHAEEGGKIYRQLKTTGKEIPVVDCMIAGVALVEKIVLITSDAKHFQRVPEIQIQEYR